jgi:excisionase family DNA binding protein
MSDRIVYEPGVVEPLLSTDEVSRVLVVPAGTLANWRWMGSGPPFLRIGRHVRYRRSDVEEWIDAQVRAADADTGRR